MDENQDDMRTVTEGLFSCPATLKEASQEDPDSPFRGPDSKKLARA